MPVTKTSTRGGLNQITANLRKLAKTEVLVGIPAAENIRKDEPIGNAALLFIHTHGSDINNIPPRPVLQPSIAANQSIILPELRKAAEAASEGQPFIDQLDAAGTIAANSAKRWFTDPRNNWPDNAPATVEAKGSDQPLIDEGELRRSITHVTRTKQ